MNSNKIGPAIGVLLLWVVGLLLVISGIRNFIEGNGGILKALFGLLNLSAGCLYLDHLVRKKSRNEPPWSRQRTFGPSGDRKGRQIYQKLPPS